MVPPETCLKDSESLAFGSVPKPKVPATSQSTCLWPTRLCQDTILENGSITLGAVPVLAQITGRNLRECLLMKMARFGRPIFIGTVSYTHR